MRPVSKRALIATAVLAGAAAFCAAILKTWDPDLFHHLAMGRHLATRGLSTGEPFLYPFAGVPGGPVPYWLGSLAIYGWEAATGMAGLTYLPSAVAAALAAVLLLDASPRASQHTPLSLAAAALPLVLAILGFRYRAVGRPELFAAVLVAVALWAVRRFEDGRRGLLFAFPAVALVWTNLHPSVVAGLAIVAALVASTAASYLRARVAGDLESSRRAGRAVLAAGGVLVASTFAALASPSPAAPLSTALRFAAAHYLPHSGAPGGGGDVRYDQLVLESIAEMQPIRAHFWVEPFGILLVLTAVTFLLRGRAARIREVVTVALFTALAVGAARFAVLLAIVCAPIAARNLAELVAALPEQAGRVRARFVGAAACVIAAVAALPISATEPGLCWGTGLRPGAYPVRGVDYLEQIGFKGRLFNTFQFGGYLSWRAIGPPYQDGRGMIRPGEERAAMRGPLDRHAFRALDREYRFDALLLAYPDEKPTSTSLFQATFGDSDWNADRAVWSLVAFDDGGLLYLRRDGAYAELAARDEYREAKPANIGFAPRPEQIPPLLVEFRRSVREAPDCALCRYYHGVAALSMGYGSEALTTLAAIPDADCVSHPLPIALARAEAERVSTAAGR